MNIIDIITTKNELDNELRIALSTMEKKEDIRNIKYKIKENQNRCPHFDSNYKLEWIGSTCPYCGKQNCKNREEGT